MNKIQTPLTAKDLVIGNKYVPLRKTALSNAQELKYSVVWNDALKINQPFLYYTGMDYSKQYHCFAAKKDDLKGGDFFRPSDMVPYVEEEVKDDQPGSNEDITELREAVLDKCDEALQLNSGIGNFGAGGSKPLYKVLNEQRTKCKSWSVGNPVAINDSEKPFSLISIYANDGLHISDKKVLTKFVKEHHANAQYTALAVNNLHILAEALEKALERMERARGILKREGANWGMLETSDLQPALQNIS